MNIFKSLFGKKENKFQVQWVGGAPVIFGSDDNDLITNGYNKNPYVYSVINLITQPISRVPWQVLKVKDEQKAKTYKALTTRFDKAANQRALMLKGEAFEVAEDHWMNKLLDKPNSSQGWAEFVENVMGFKLLLGNSYIYLLSPDMGVNKGRPQQMIPLPAHFMNIKPERDMLSAKGYTLNVFTREIEFEKQEIVHLKNWNPNWSANGQHLYGHSPLATGRDVIQKSNDGFRSAMKLLQNSGAMGILVNKDAQGDMNEEQLSKMENKYYEKYGGANNRGKIMISNSEFSWQQIGMNAVDLGLEQAQKNDKKDIFSLFGVNVILANENEQASYNNIKEARKGMIQNVSIPHLYSLRDELNRQLLDDEDVILEPNVNVIPEMQEDLNEMVDTLSKAYWLSFNEKRVASNYPQDETTPLANTYFIPSTIQPIEMTNIDEQKFIDYADTDKK